MSVNGDNISCFMTGLFLKKNNAAFKSEEAQARKDLSAGTKNLSKL